MCSEDSGEIDGFVLSYLTKSSELTLAAAQRVVTRQTHHESNGLKYQ